MSNSRNMQPIFFITKKSGLKSCLQAGKPTSANSETLGFLRNRRLKAASCPQNPINFIGGFRFPSAWNWSGEIMRTRQPIFFMKWMGFCAQFVAFKRRCLKNQGVSELALVGFPGKFSIPIFWWWKNRFYFTWIGLIDNDECFLET